MRGVWSNVRQATVAEVRLDASKSARFTASAQSIYRSIVCYAHDARFIVAQAARKGRSWPHNYRGSGDVGWISLDIGGTAEKRQPQSPVVGRYYVGNPYCSSPVHGVRRTG